MCIRDRYSPAPSKLHQSQPGGVFLWGAGSFSGWGLSLIHIFRQHGFVIAVEDYLEFFHSAQQRQVGRRVNDYLFYGAVGLPAEVNRCV